MATVQIRLSDEEKAAAREIFGKMGLTFSAAVKIFLRKVIAEKKIPFEISTEKNAKNEKWTNFATHEIGSKN